MLIGYARVSTEGQRLDRQIDQLVEAGVDPRCIYSEQVSGTKRNRPELNKMLDDLREGDVVLIPDLTRLSRSTKDLLEIIGRISEKGAAVRSLKDSWLDTTNKNPYGQFLLVVMAGLSQLERDLTCQRVKEGLAAARARGRVGGRPSKQQEHAEAVKAMSSCGMKIVDIMKTTGLSRSTIQRILRE